MQKQDRAVLNGNCGAAAGTHRPRAFGRSILLCACCAGALLLAAGAPAARANDTDSDLQAPDGSFPLHGDCTFLGNRAQELGRFGAAADQAAAEARTWETLRVVGALPHVPLSIRSQSTYRPAAGIPATGPCTSIDDCIEKTARAAGVPLTHSTTDEEFLRRVRLDLTGRIPTAQEVLAFEADTSADKRAKLVDRLLGTSEWADRWAMFFGDLFRNTQFTAQVNRYQHTRDSFHLWLRDSLRENKPYDQMAREMLSAQGFSDGRAYPDSYTDYNHFRRVVGDFASNPVRPTAVGYVVGGRTTGGPIQDTYDTLASLVARDFLGIAIMDCVLCHDGAGHLEALNLWGAEALRLEGWQLASFFADLPRHQTWRTPRRRLPINPNNDRPVNANYYKIQDLAPGRTQATRQGDTAGEYLAQTEGGNRPDRLHSQRVVEPSYPFRTTATVPAGLRLREQVGHHLTGDPQFARAAVNYIWREFFSRGIVEPADQFDLARQDPAAPPDAPWDIQPSHPQLLSLLAQGFRESGHDLQWLMREITTSNTYQLSSRYEGAFSPLHEKYFVRHQVKRLSAEQMHDAIMTASGRFNTYNPTRSIRGIRYAMQFPDVRNMPPGNGANVRNARVLLQAFTPGDREESPRSREGSPLQALNLMNHPFIMARLSPAPANTTLNGSLDLADDSALVSNLYLNVLSRRPTADELDHGVNYVGNGNRRTKAANLMWVLLNKTDFIFNY